MGANYEDVSFICVQGEEEAIKRFLQLCEESAIHDGIEYSGRFGMHQNAQPRVVDRTGKKFQTVDEACSYFMTIHDKWQPPLCARIREGSQVWYFGAWCPS